MEITPTGAPSLRCLKMAVAMVLDGICGRLLHEYDRIRGPPQADYKALTVRTTRGMTPLQVAQGEKYVG